MAIRKDSPTTHCPFGTMLTFPVANPGTTRHLRYLKCGAPGSPQGTGHMCDMRPSTASRNFRLKTNPANKKYHQLCEVAQRAAQTHQGDTDITIARSI